MKPLNKILFITVAVLCVSAIGSSASAEGLSPTTAGSTFTRDLTVGMRGDDVSALQQFLITGGFLKISAPTGYFGPLMRAALSTWQAQSGISPSTGFFGSISRKKINAAAQAVQQAPVNATPSQSAAKITTSTAATNATVAKSGDGSPVRLTIPRLNVNAGFQYNGLKSDGVMEIPDNIVDVGWFTGSPRPGEKGVAIITGHVAQIRGGIKTKPGVFNNLNELRAGDKLSVLNDKGKTVTFVVRESRNYDPSADATDVFTSKDGGAHLNIITCEGTWNPAKLSYTQRLVVFTDAVK